MLPVTKFLGQHLAQQRSGIPRGASSAGEDRGGRPCALIAELAPYPRHKCPQLSGFGFSQRWRSSKKLKKSFQNN